MPNLLQIATLNLQNLQSLYKPLQAPAESPPASLTPPPPPPTPSLTPSTLAPAIKKSVVPPTLLLSTLGKPSYTNVSLDKTSDKDLSSSEKDLSSSDKDLSSESVMSGLRML